MGLRMMGVVRREIGVRGGEAAAARARGCARSNAIASAKRNAATLPRSPCRLRLLLSAMLAMMLACTSHGLCSKRSMTQHALAHNLHTRTALRSNHLRPSLVNLRMEADKEMDVPDERVLQVRRLQLPSSRRSVLFLVAAAAAGLGIGTASPSFAGYGAAGGAVKSSPPLEKFSLEDWLLLDPEKLDQRLGSISRDRAAALIQEIQALSEEGASKALDVLVEKLSEQETTAELATQLAELRARRAEQEAKERLAQQLQSQLKEQETLLKELDAQPAWVVYGAALAASMASTLAMHPVDTLKTNRQAGVEGGKAVSLGSLYKGVSANLLKEMPSSALYLGIYESLKGQLLAPTSPIAGNPLLVYLIAGAVGEGAGSVVRAPAEVMKTRVQAGLAGSTAEAFTQLASDPALRSATVTSWSTSILRDVPFGAIQIAVFEGLKIIIVQSPDVNFDTNTLLSEAVLGAAGGFVGSLFSAPADVVVTRLVTQAEGVERVGLLTMAKRIYEENGIEGFINGARERAAYWTPAIGIFLSVYCTLRKFALLNF